MTTPNLPPRKGVTAWEMEPLEENGDEFFVLTFHHGLGEMTRLDLDANDVQGLVGLLIKSRLEDLRSQIQAERISYGELAELADLAGHIDPGDVELLEWAGVREFPDTADLGEPVDGINKDYAVPKDVVALRIYTESNPDEEAADWMLDGVDAEGKYTESCWTFNTEQEAIEAIVEFCVTRGITDGPSHALALPVIRPVSGRHDSSRGPK